MKSMGERFPWTWGEEFLAGRTIGLLRVAKIISVTVEVPTRGKGIKLFATLFAYASGKNKTDSKAAEDIKSNLERYLTELEKTAEILESYDKEQMTRSRLAFEVKLGFMCCASWGEAIAAGKVPTDIKESLKRKTGRLQTYLSLECLEHFNEMDKKIDKLAKDMNGFLHPLVYYNEGKEAIEKSNWMEAKTKFLIYRNFVEKKDPRCKKPEEDNFFHHLGYIQAQMDTQGRDPLLSGRDPICSVIPDGVDNEYRKLFRQWLKAHPRKSTLADPLKSIKPHKK